MKTVTIHANEVLGKIKRLNGLGGGPRSSLFTFNAVKEFHDAGIPFCRTHDIEYPFGAGEFVDIHNIFRDFDKDPNDPASYNFTMTDAYLKAIEEAGAKPFYRLGSSIEHQEIKLYIFPPKDVNKWAQVCSHIVSHYNEGWANGFHMGIEYWEIWNEPDDNPSWAGDGYEYINMYITTARLLKKEHPYIKVGGPTVCGPDVWLTKPFLDCIKAEQAPFDFFSFHGYCHTPKQARSVADLASSLMEQYGFDKTETVMDEWNYIADWGKGVETSLGLHKTAFCASFIAGTFSELQDSKLDISVLYDAQILGSIAWNSFFSPGPMASHAGERGVICEKPYYTLKAWTELSRTGEQVAIEKDCSDLYVTAVRGEEEIKVLVTLFNDDNKHNTCPPADEEVEFVIDGAEYTDLSVQVIDNEHDYESIAVEKPEMLFKGNETTAVLTFRLK